MRLSVIVPVHNGGEDLRQCLQALLKSTRLPDELIVVDDASTDASANIASEFNALIIAQDKVPVGPAKSRNRGAGIAQGDILIFIDSDVVVHENTLAAFEDYFIRHPGIVALFGSYDDHPPHRNSVSLYKNLQHHFVHQHGKQEASTFWAGAGAVRRDVFVKVGGFNESYVRPSIEDIEFGFRLRNSGNRVWLCPDIQVTHLKRWNFFSWLRSDIFDRAIPWTRLILSSSRMPSDLNLDLKSRVSALCVWGMFLSVGLGFWLPVVWLGAFLFLVLYLKFNFALYYFFHTRGGFWFALAGTALHALYFCYSSLIFGLSFGGHLFSRRNKNMHLLVPMIELAEESRNDS
jgi:GT2 family glycosyltransferase